MAAFGNCTTLAEISIPDSVTYIRNGASPWGTFGFCFSLTNVNIGNSLTHIGAYMFSSCSNLTSVTVPGSVVSIGSNAFEDCSKLRSVYFQGNAPSLDDGSFTSDNNTTVYYLPETTGWSSTFGGRPAVLWNPHALVMDASVGSTAKLHVNQRLVLFQR
jgi:hypothetical protein